MIMPKYELTDETINIEGHVLHRIRAMKDFNDVKKGDVGGFIESEANLSHEGNAWVYDDVCVYGDARIFEEASVLGGAEVFGNARIFGKSLGVRRRSDF